MALGAESIGLWRIADLDGQKEAPAAEMQVRHGPVVGVALPHGKELVTVHESGVVVGWELDSVFDKEPVIGWEFEANILVAETAYSLPGADGRFLLALGGKNGQLLVAAFEAGAEHRWARIDDAHQDKIEVLKFSDDGHCLASSGRDRVIAIWSTEFQNGEEPTTLKRQKALTGSGGWPLSLAFSGDHRRLVSGCMDNGVYLWDLTSEQPLMATRFEHHGWVEDVEWTDNDETVISGSWDDTIGVFDGASLAPDFQFMYHQDYVVRALPVPKTSLVLAASYDGDVTVWDWRQGRLEGVLEGHCDWVTDLVWLGDDLVASLSSDRTARLWSLDDLSLVAVLGESLVGQFELKGGYDLASFGIGERQPSIEDHSGPDLESLQDQVVRRFDRDEQFDSPGSQGTAEAMLEQAVERVDSIDPGRDMPAVDNAATESSAPQALGDELSDMVWDAISDVEEVDEHALDSVPDDDDELIDVDEKLSQGSDLLDVAEMETADKALLDAPQEEGEDETTQGSGLLDVPEMETADKALLDAPQEEDEEETTQGSGLLDVPEMETADKALLDAPREEDEEETTQGSGLLHVPEMETAEKIIPDGPPEQSSEEELSEEALESSDPEQSIEDDEQRLEDPYSDEPLQDVELNIPPEDDDAPSAQDLAKEAFDDATSDDADLLFMDSVFDTAAPISDDEDDAGEEEGDSEDSSPVPTSGPLYNPRPIEAQDHVDELLPDDDMLDLAFSSSFGEVLGDEQDSEPETEKSDPGATGASAAEEGDAAAEEGDAAAEDGDPSDDDERAPPGKTDPSSAGGRVRQRAGDGKDNQWASENAPSTLTRAKPLMANDEEEQSLAAQSSTAKMESSSPRRGRRSTTAPGHQMGADSDVSDTSPKGNVTMTPFTDTSEVSEDKVSVASKTEKKQRGSTAEMAWKPPRVNRDVLEKLARNLNRDPKERPDTPAESPPEEDSHPRAARPPKSQRDSGDAPTPADAGATAQQQAARHKKSKKSVRRTHVGGGPMPSRNPLANTNNKAMPSAERPQRDDTKRRQTQVGGRPKPGAAALTPASKEKQPAAPRQKGRDFSPEKKIGASQKEVEEPEIGALKLDAQVGNFSLGAEETAGMIDGDASAQSVSPNASSPPQGKLGQNRLQSGEKQTADSLQMPEPKSNDVGESGFAHSSEKLSFRELWRRANAMAPKMGVLKRRRKPLSKDIGYKPYFQIATDHRGDIALAVSSDQKRLITAGEGGRVDIWDIRNGERSQVLATQGTWVDVGFVGDDNLCFGLDRQGRIYLWLLTNKVAAGSISGPFSVIEDPSIAHHSAQLAEDGRLLITGSDAGQAYIWELDQGNCAIELTGHTAPVSAVDFGKKGPITAGLDGQIRFWNWQGLQVDQIDSSDEVRDLVASHGRVFWVESSGALRMMEEGAREPVKLQGHHGEGRAVASRGDGYCVSGGEDGRLLLYDGISQELRQEIHIPAPIQKVTMRERVLGAACAGAIVFLFRRQKAK